MWISVYYFEMITFKLKNKSIWVGEKNSISRLIFCANNGCNRHTRPLSSNFINPRVIHTRDKSLSFFISCHQMKVTLWICSKLPNWWRNDKKISNKSFQIDLNLATQTGPKDVKKNLQINIQPEFGYSLQLREKKRTRKAHSIKGDKILVYNFKTSFNSYCACGLFFTLSEGFLWYKQYTLCKNYHLWKQILLKYFKIGYLSVYLLYG